MSDTGNKKTVDELDEALRLLDHELSGVGLDEPLQIRAIGGYALLKHGIRSEERAFTVDIDTVTKDYSAAVIRAVETVAERAGLDADWLNNYNVMGEPEDVEAMFDAEWEPQSLDLRNIAVSIASVPTLTRSKIMAADTAEFSGRDRDIPDLAELLDHQGITTMKAFERKYPDPFGEYPTAHELVRKHLGEAAPAQRPASRYAELDDLELDDPYDFDDGAGDDLDDDLLYR